MALQSDHEFAPTQIARAVFPTAFRGYDQDAVRRYLSRLAAALEHQQSYAGLGELEARTPAHERVEELESEVESLRDEIRDLELELVQRSVDGEENETSAADGGGAVGEDDAAVFDEHRAIELLGKETARVLESARSAAADILKRAETQAGSLKSQAKTELAEAQRRAETLFSTKRAEVEDYVATTTAEADERAATINADAEEHHRAVVEETSKILAEAEAAAAAEQADAQDRATQIMADAETLRQQVIAELVAERREAQAEMDRMTAARDRLAMSLVVARSELDEVADALMDASPAPMERSRSTLDRLVADGLGPDGSPDDDPEVLDLGLIVDAAPTTDANPAEEADQAGDGDGDGAPTGRSATKPAAGSKPSKAKKGETKAKPKKRQSKTKAAGKQRADRAKPAGASSGETGSTDAARSADRPDDRGEITEANPGVNGDGPVRITPAGAEPLAGDERSAAPGDDGSAEASPEPAAHDEAADEAAAEPERGVTGSFLPADQNPDGPGTGTGSDTDDRPGDRDPSTPPKSASGSGSASGSEPGSPSGAEPDLEPVEVEILAIDDPEVNQPPADGEPLTLVEGFTTIELMEEAESSQTIDLTDDSPDANADDTGAPDDAGADGANPDLQHSVVVNEPQIPEEVITTVVSRTATGQPDRTQGDLLIDEPFTGRLSKEFAARDVALTRSGPNFRRQLRRALNDDQSDVLDRLRAGKGPIDVAELPAFGEQIDRYLSPLRRGLAEIAQAGATAGGQSDLSNAALDNLVRQLARYIVDKVRNPILAVIDEATDQDREKILSPVRAIYRDFRNVGLPDLTEDALYEAFAIGLYDSIEPSAPVSWVTDPRCDPDPVCEINRDRTDLVKGEVFPSGHARPLSLPGCRCLVMLADY